MPNQQSLPPFGFKTLSALSSFEKKQLKPFTEHPLKIQDLDKTYTLLELEPLPPFQLRFHPKTVFPLRI
jgi:hypothetical protein